MVWTFHADDLDSPDVLALLALHFETMRANSPRDACHVLPVASLRAPGISFWSVREGGRLLGVGALKQLAANHGEVKSMRTDPQALGRGVGTAMLHHIITQARGRGYRRLSLETGNTDAFAAALRLYGREGFVACESFGEYRASSFTRLMSRAL